ncbi:peptidoglycan DD-metalloendopeptidase family protein [Methyloceanibacter sp.]|jgi:murein DD-endopeptidase MepM/ murein hydrolase activator NlpD|uniref:peptidoglycan DD-metalloendopeptidase family protein n=1 Tax=Methyloceanibacter sp. TaxID=1965321 RepID=UPI002C7CA008|nr:M23 family metallopeptidase [Methyloceanibacter sp.]
MRQAAFGICYRRLLYGVLGATLAALALCACSSGARFDSLGFGSSQSQADLSTTAALPIPQESVYGTGTSGAPHYYGNPNGQLARSSLPAQNYTPRALPAAYTPVDPPKSNLRAPGAQPAVMYGGTNPASGFRVKAGKGDTLSVLSRRYGVPVEAIQSANNLGDGRLSPGQELIIPTVRKPSAAETPKPQVAAATPKAVTDANPAVRVVKTTTIPAPGSTPAGASGDAEPAETTNDVAASREVTGEPKTRVANIGQLPSPEPMSGNSFRWPVKGRVIAGFGSKPDGGHNDGINLAVPQGTSVKAAENGVVAYAGNELKGYGNLVLVRHANNWVSAYAHNDEILVKRGDKVRRGEIIAKAGATGSVSSPQVHFELRKGSRPVDPTKYMSDAAASAE